jgi:hypothetical protein
LDGADSNTITGTTSVTAWRDKSGNARHLGVGAGTTSYSSNAIQLNSSYMFVDSPVNLSNVTMFILAKTTGGNNQTVFTTKSSVSQSYNTLDGFGFYMDGTTSVRLYGQYGGGVSSFATNTSTPKLFSYQSSGTSISVWMNAISQVGATLSSSRTSTAGGFGIGAEWTNEGGGRFQNFYVIASIYEILVYNSVLTTSERQQVEGYLAHKWGLSLSIPSTHPFYSIRPHLRTFQPTDVTGCQLWLDAADTSSMTFSGSTITQWSDKSGNGYHATIASGRIGATYSSALNAVNFATSSTGYVTSYPANPTNETMFVVFNNPTPSSGNNILIGGVQGARSLGAGYTNAGIGTVGNLNTQVVWLASTGTYTAGTTVFTTSQFTPSSNSISLNGGTAASGGAPGFTAGRVTYLGVDATNPVFYYVGYAMEILFYNSILTTSQRQQVEGYLAHKWGLTTPIPSTHPFKSILPASVDTTTISATGGTITTSGSYKIHTFTTVGTTTFTLTNPDSITAEVLVVAGGGGGGYDDGGGGGAGGVIYRQSFTITSGSYTITLGNGGTSGTLGVDGGNGGNTTFSSLTAIGGGGGATSNGNGKNGGSGGGVGWGASTPGTGTAGQGNAGGGGTSEPNYCAGGGGGAGGVGGTGAGITPGNGGIGVSHTIAGTTYNVGGGGGGGLAGQNSSGTNSTASFGGGNGAGKGSAAPGSGSPNTGGGGGGGNNQQATNGGTGGSGIVIIAYTV